MSTYTLPGDEISKIFPYLMPIADHVGGIFQLEQLIEQDVIEPAHLGFVRGRDIKNSILFVDEGENLTKQHIQLLLGRIAKGSELWIAGDMRQVDHINFEKNSGIRALVNSLKGNPLFGTVKLMKSERSEIAKLADLLD